ncbi:hypothetical protein D3C76_805730 [compost metagenome]
MLFDELADADVAERVDRCAADIGQACLAIEHLVTGANRVTRMRVRQLPAVHVVIDTAGVGRAAVAALEVAQVGGQHAAGQRQVVNQADEILAVEMLELTMEIAHAQLLADRVINSSETEVARFSAGIAVKVQPSTVGRVSLLEAVEVAGAHGQPVDIGAGQLGALVSLRQQACIVVDQHRRLGQQGAMADHGVAQAGLGC